MNSGTDGKVMVMDCSDGDGSRSRGSVLGMGDYEVPVIEARTPEGSPPPPPQDMDLEAGQAGVAVDGLGAEEKERSWTAPYP
jgi:hypothetical protein